MQGYPNLHTSAGASHMRHQQIAELTQQIPSCRALNRDQSLFEAPVRLQDGRTTNLRLIIPASFPQERPGLQVTHPIQHPWVNASGRMSFPSLEHWNPSHSRLAGVVQEAFSALTGHPMRSPASSPQRQGPSPSRQNSSPSRPATIPNEFPEVQAMGSEELLAVLTDVGRYQQLLRSIALKFGTEQVRDQLQDSNLQIARANLAQEGVLAELRNQIAIIRSSEYAVVKESFDKSHARQRAVLAKLQPEALVEALAVQAQKAESQADTVQASFQRGELSTEAFVEQYTAARKLFHQRDLKCQAARQTLLS